MSLENSMRRNLKVTKEDFERKSDIERNFDLEKRTIDERFGEIAIIKNRKTGQIAMLKESVSNNESEAREDILQVKRRLHLNHKYMQKMYDFSCQKKSNFCSKFFKVRGFYEYPKNDLKQEILTRKKNLKEFNHEELTHMGYQILLALEYLQDNNVAFGDLRPEHVSVYNKKKEFKLLDRLNDPSSTMQSQLNNILANRPLYCSPSIFSNIKRSKKKLKHDPFKSDCFSLGLVLLEAGTLDNIQDIFDHRRKEVSEERLEKHLNCFREKYEQDNALLCDLTQNLLTLDEEDRFNPKQFNEELPPYEEILEHFKNNPVTNNHHHTFREAQRDFTEPQEREVRRTVAEQPVLREPSPQHRRTTPRVDHSRNPRNTSTSRRDYNQRSTHKTDLSGSRNHSARIQENRNFSARQIEIDNSRGRQPRQTGNSIDPGPELANRLIDEARENYNRSQKKTNRDNQNNYPQVIQDHINRTTHTITYQQSNNGIPSIPGSLIKTINDQNRPSNYSSVPGDSSRRYIRMPGTTTIYPAQTHGAQIRHPSNLRDQGGHQGQPYYQYLTQSRRYQTNFPGEGSFIAGGGVQHRYPGVVRTDYPYSHRDPRNTTRDRTRDVSSNYSSKPIIVSGLPTNYNQQDIQNLEKEEKKTFQEPQQGKENANLENQEPITHNQEDGQDLKQDNDEKNQNLPEDNHGPEETLEQPDQQESGGNEKVPDENDPNLDNNLDAKEADQGQQEAQGPDQETNKKNLELPGLKNNHFQRPSSAVRANYIPANIHNYQNGNPYNNYGFIKNPSTSLAHQITGGSSRVLPYTPSKEALAGYQSGREYRKTAPSNGHLDPASIRIGSTLYSPRKDGSTTSHMPSYFPHSPGTHRTKFIPGFDPNSNPIATTTTYVINPRTMQPEQIYQTQAPLKDFKSAHPDLDWKTPGSKQLSSNVEIRRLNGDRERSRSRDPRHTKNNQLIPEMNSLQEGANQNQVNTTIYTQNRGKSRDERTRQPIGFVGTQFKVPHSLYSATYSKPVSYVRANRNPNQPEIRTYNSGASVIRRPDFHYNGSNPAYHPIQVSHHPPNYGQPYNNSSYGFRPPHEYHGQFQSSLSRDPAKYEYERVQLAEDGDRKVYRYLSSEKGPEYDKYYTTEPQVIGEKNLSSQGRGRRTQERQQDLMKNQIDSPENLEADQLPNNPPTTAQEIESYDVPAQEKERIANNYTSFGARDVQQNASELQQESLNPQNEDLEDGKYTNRSQAHSGSLHEDPKSVENYQQENKSPINQPDSSPQHQVSDTAQK